MVGHWFLKDIEHQLSRGNRVVILDPNGQCGFLLKLLGDSKQVVLTTDSGLKEHWQTVKEELFLRHRAETEFKDVPVIFYITRKKNKLSFLFDYCSTHGFLDLSRPTDWLKQKLFAHTGLQIQMDNPLLLTAAKLGIGKDITWWKKILQNLGELLSIEDELLPFFSAPVDYLNTKEPDIRRLFEEKVFEILKQPYMAKPPETLAREVVNRLLDGLVYNDVHDVLRNVYYRWTDSDQYRPSLIQYISAYNLDADANPWSAHPDHCFEALDRKALSRITASMRDKSFLQEKLSWIKTRAGRTKVKNFIPSWWQDFLTLVEFDAKELAMCDSLEKTVSFYANSFLKVDRAIRHLFESFLHEEPVIRPLQEYYEILNYELLQVWFAYQSEYKETQQGYLVSLLKNAQPGIAVIVGDGIRYEIADTVAVSLSKKFSVDKGIMLADLPSETEHNMSALFAGNHEIIPLQKDREERLLAAAGKPVVFSDLESVNHGLKADFLVLTYKDIDSAGEKLQQGALKLFSEFEQVLIDKITLLLNIGFREVHLVTDHGFVLTGLLDESDKIEPAVSGKKAVHERYIRCEYKQDNPDLLVCREKYDDYNYVCYAKNHRPFKSRGVYGYSHGGCTPQETVLPAFVFRKAKSSAKALGVIIANKKDLKSVTGDIFSIKLQSAEVSLDLFASSRRVQLLLFAGTLNFGHSNIVSMELNTVKTLEFSFSGHKTIKAVLVDAETQEQIDHVIIEKSNIRDTGGLL